jgi:2-keto-3-deoxy-L-rhamnonate aldolase RhmA
VAAACQTHGVVPGNFALGEAKAQAMLAAGYPFLATGTDVGLLESAARQNVAFIDKLKKATG